MIKNITKELRFCKNDILQLSLIPIGGWVIGEIVSFLIITLSNEETYFSVGGLLSLLAVAIMAVLVPVTQILLNFEIIVGFGRTRKQYLAGIALVLFLEIIAMIFVALVSSLLSIITKSLFFSELTTESFFGIITLPMFLEYWWIAPIAALLLTMLGFITSALVKKFTTKVLWIFWAIYMVITLSFSGAVGNAENLPFFVNIFDFLATIPIFAYIIGLVVLLGTGLFFSVKYLLRASVSNG